MRNDLNLWVPRLMEKLQSLPELRDVASDQLNSGLKADLVIDRDTASRLGILPQAIDDTLYDAFGQRQVSTIFTQLNQYHVVLEADPQFQQSPDSLKSIYVHSQRGAAGSALCLHAFLDSTNALLAINHQGQFPVVTISFNLAPGTSLGEATKAIDQAEHEINLPASIHTSFQGTAAAFQNSLSSEPYLILAALVTVYIVLGVLYESYIHPITILSTLAVRRRGRDPRSDPHPQRFQRHRADRHHPADRHREEKRHHDDRLRARSGARGREAARGSDLPGLPAALSSHHDDHDGRAARRLAARARHRVLVPSCVIRLASPSSAD